MGDQRQTDPSAEEQQMVNERSLVSLQVFPQVSTVTRYLLIVLGTHLGFLVHGPWSKVQISWWNAGQVLESRLNAESWISDFVLEGLGERHWRVVQERTRCWSDSKHMRKSTSMNRA